MTTNARIFSKRLSQVTVVLVVAGLFACGSDVNPDRQGSEQQDGAACEEAQEACPATCCALTGQRYTYTEGARCLTRAEGTLSLCSTRQGELCTTLQLQHCITQASGGSPRAVVILPAAPSGNLPDGWIVCPTELAALSQSECG